MKNIIYEFIQITELPREKDRKTSKFLVRNINVDCLLGFIKWHPSWRCYAFYPEKETFFEDVCLNNITSFLEKLKEERKNGK